jgi:hypothetical protein
MLFELIKRGARIAVAMTVVTQLGGCGVLGLGEVKPWEKGTLAQPAMKMDANPLEARYEDHIYVSKEASSGGTAVGGGGCGCN